MKRSWLDKAPRTGVVGVVGVVGVGVGLATPGCGGGPAGTASSRPAAAALAPLAVRLARLVAPPAGSDDPVVATVDGAPIRASCVAGQRARTPGTTIDAALAACVDVELLAREAARRGLDDAPEVIDATRIALVDQLIATEFTARRRSAADLPADQRAGFEASVRRMSRPELRASAFVRFVVPPGTPPEREAAIGAAAERTAAALATQTGLFEPDLDETARRIAVDAGLSIEANHTELRPRGWFASAPYGDALFALPEIGRASATFRTARPEPPGWDIVILTDLKAADPRTPEQLIEELFPEVRRRSFAAWADALGPRPERYEASGLLDEAAP
jgi:hypothetical protein